MTTATGYYSDTGRIDDLIDFVHRHPDLLLIPEHGIAGGRTLLHIAASYGSVEVCENLIGRGISINAPSASSGNQLPISEAAGRGHLDLVRWLIDHGACVDGLSTSVTTPVMVAAMNGHRSVVELLLQCGADINRLHLRTHQTSLDFAQVYQHDHVADLLRKAGALHAIEPVDYSGNGGGILAHVEQHVGCVLSSRLTREWESCRVEYRTALIRRAKDYKLLFSLGINSLAPSIELMICLKSDWPTGEAVLASGGHESFPLRLLWELSRIRLKGRLIEEGDIVERAMLSVEEAFWPSGVDAFLVVDYQFYGSVHKEQGDEEVKMLALVPIQYTKSMRPTGQRLQNMLFKLRTASWKRIALKP
jgi:uncharacterized protein